MAKLKREKIWIDPEIVSNLYKHGENHVEYYLWHDKSKFDAGDPDALLKEVKKKKIHRQTDVCFGSMLQYTHDSAWTMSNTGGWRNTANYEKPKSDPHNRVLYNMTEDSCAKEKLTAQEKHDWIKLSKENKMLPRYMPLKDVKYYESTSIPMVLQLGKKSVVSLVFVYLSQLRYLREYPGFVRSVLHLHQEHDMDFVAAFVAASLVSLDYTVHHYLTVQRKYGDRNDVNTADKIPLHAIAGIKRFLKSPGRYDKREFYKTRSGYKGSCTIEGISKITDVATVQDLFEPLVKRAFCAMTDETTRKYLKQYAELKKKIQYMEAKNK